MVGTGRRGREVGKGDVRRGVALGAEDRGDGHRGGDGRGDKPA